jgi:hypothetical protein
VVVVVVAAGQGCRGGPAGPGLPICVITRSGAITAYRLGHEAFFGFIHRDQRAGRWWRLRLRLRRIGDAEAVQQGQNTQGGVPADVGSSIPQKLPVDDKRGGLWLSSMTRLEAEREGSHP